MQRTKQRSSPSGLHNALHEARLICISEAHCKEGIPKSRPIATDGRIADAKAGPGVCIEHHASS